MKKRNSIALGLIAVFITLIPSCENKPTFSTKEDPEGIMLYENGDPVFFYQRKPKSMDSMYTFNNYLHPVYNLKGEIITEEFPPDHPHHRGIFWAWHQLYTDNQSLGDGWMMENVSQDVISVNKKLSNKIALYNLDVLWKSSSWQNNSAFIEEQTSIVVHRIEADIRKIDFEIVLKPLVPGVQIGGSADEKGYGGFSVRIKLPDSTVFTSEEGQVTPQNLQIISGPWMDFSSTSDISHEKSGLIILCHPSTPNYPAPWILRQKASMQNIVFPGSDRIKLDKSLVLRYRVIIHNGDAERLNIDMLQSEYNKTSNKN